MIPDKILKMNENTKIVISKEDADKLDLPRNTTVGDAKKAKLPKKKKPSMKMEVKNDNVEL